MNQADYIVNWLRSFAEEEAKSHGLTDHLETSDHNASHAADIIERQQHQIAELQTKVVMEFSHTDIPEFSQGFDPAEVLGVVTAERCAELVASIGNQATLIRDLQAQLAAKDRPFAKIAITETGIQTSIYGEPVRGVFDVYTASRALW